LNANMAATKMRWGDTLDEDMGDELPPPSVVGPDAKGVKITTTYRKNDKGETVKTVIKTKFTKVERKVYQVCMTAQKMLDQGKAQRKSRYLFVAQVPHTQVYAACSQRKSEENGKDSGMQQVSSQSTV